MRRWFPCAAAAVLTALGVVAVAVAPRAGAATFTVDTTDDHDDGSCTPGDCALREAVAAANAAGGADVINFDGGTITIPATFPLTLGRLVVNGDDLTIANNLTGDFTDITLDALAGGRAFNVGAVALTIQGITVTGGTAAGTGLGINSAGDVTLDNARVTANSQTGSPVEGGGVYAVNVTVQNGSEVSNNDAGGLVGVNGDGGGIAATGLVTVTDSTISGNTAGNGGGGISAGSVTITGSTVSGNESFGYDDAGGAGIVASGDVVIEGGSIISGNLATSGGPQGITQGGGVWSQGGSITVTDSTISGNSAIGPTNGTGGGLVTGDGNIVIVDSTIAGNEAVFGGGAVASNVAQDATLQLDHSLLTGNTATGHAGGALAQGDLTIQNDTLVQGNAAGGSFGGVSTQNGVLTITDSTIGGPDPGDGNTADSDGAGGVGGAGGVVLTSSTIQGNAAGGSVGGIGSQGGPVVITDSVISDNAAQTGSAGGVMGGTITVSGSLFSGNQAPADSGGALISLSGALDVDTSWFLGNSAEFAGAGLSIAAPSLSVTASTFSGNTASNTGGALIVLNAVGAVDLENLTITGNGALIEAGAMHFVDSTVSLRNLTIASNTAPTGANLLIDASADVTVANSILSDPTVPNCDGSITDGGYNLVYDDGSGTSGTCIFDAATDVLDEDPGLGALQLNAPGTTPTMAITADSPAAARIPVADCPAADQRGVPITGTVCDIGAYQSRTQPTPPTTSASTTTTPTTSAPTTAASTATTAAPADSSTSPIVSGTLPRTGGDDHAARWAAVLVAAGFACLLAGRGRWRVHRRAATG